MSIFNSELKTLQAARAAADKLSAHDRQMREAHAAAVAEAQAVTAAFEPRDVIKRRMSEWVDATRAHVLTREGPSMVLSFSGRLHPVTKDDGTTSLEPTAGVDEWRLPRELSLEFLCWIVPDSLKSAFGDAIDAAVFAAGSPITKRLALIAEAEGRVAAIEAEHTALVDGALAAGITLQLLPAVRLRREAEAQRLERAAAAAAAHAPMAARVNQRFERVGRSEYLAHGRRSPFA